MCKTTGKPKIRSVKFEYVGTDEQFVRFLKCVFRDYISTYKVNSDELHTIVLKS